MDLNTSYLKITTFALTTKYIFMGIWKDLKMNKAQKKQGKSHSLLIIN